MPLLFQKRIYREDAVANRKANLLYVFGDNAVRKGYGGQAAELRDAPNSVGVATKWTPGMGPKDFFNDADYDEIITVLDDDLKPIVMALEHGATVIWPLDGIGTGLSQLPDRAPKVWAYLQNRLLELQHITSL